MIIFDFDGTIADTLNVSVKCINMLAEKYDYGRIKRHLIQKKPFKDVITDDLKLSFSELGFFLKELKMLIRDNLNEIKIVPGMRDVLKKLALKHKLGIATSNSSFIVKKILERNSIDVFEFIHSDLALFGKEHILRRYGGIYVGDEVRDIYAARKAGIKIISVTWGYNSKELLLKNKPDFIADKPNQIIEIVERL